jgi:hypothetical protein
MTTTVKERMDAKQSEPTVYANSRVAELEAQALVMKLEQELERARQVHLKRTWRELNLRNCLLFVVNVMPRK